MREQLAQQTVRQTDDYVDELDDDAIYTTRMPNSAIRLNNPTLQSARVPQTQVPTTPAIHRRSLYPPNGTSVQPGTYSDGNTKVNVHYGAPPPPKQKGRTMRDTEEPQAVQRRKRHIHPLLYLGIGMIIMLALWVALTSLVSWVQVKMNDLSYGYPRTYQIDGVINQNGDSQANPTHIIFLNLNRKIEVIVQPAGDASKAHIYVITTLLEAGSELFPVKGYIKDLGNGKPDIVVIINGSGRTALMNTGTDFRLVQPSDNPKY